ncbi:MAG: GerMN domain-containing protein [Ilumatobacteraceae bacterium]
MIALMLIGLFVVSCGVSGESGFEPIASDKIPDQLTATTTTTTTTTTATTTTVPSTSSTIDDSNVTTTLPETTTTNLPTELIDVYYVVGRTIVGLEIPFPRNPQIAQVLLALEQTPPADFGPGYRTAVPAEKMTFTSEVRGLVTIELAPDFFTGLDDSSDPTRAIAQIVMTLTRLRGISLVSFTMNGEPASVLLADSSPSEPGQALNYDDYSSLLNQSPPPVSTTTTTTTTSPVIGTVPTDSTAG